MISGASFKQQIHTYQLLDNWFYSPQGVWLSQYFLETLKAYHSILRGNHLLQLGLCGTNSWLNELGFSYKWIASPYSSHQHNQIVTSLAQLPLEKASMDCVCAPLTMEAFKNNHAIIDEMDRILKPMGYLVILGINPLSFWGAASKFGLLSGVSSRTLTLHSSFSVNRACIARGYKQHALINFGYLPAFKTSERFKQLFFIEEVGKMLWPFPAGFYCYIAQKYENQYDNPIFSYARLSEFSV
jgi:hypothetical protein